MNILVNGVWDLFHIGHLNILERAKKLNGTVIAGVNTDDWVFSYKQHNTVFSYEERQRLVFALKCVDKVVPHHAMDETEIFEKYKIDILVVGSDWGKFPKQKKIKTYLKQTGRKLVVFPYTKGISTTEIIEWIREKAND